MTRPDTEPTDLLTRYYDSMLPRVGESREYDRGVITATQIRHFARAIGEQNPVHFDRAAAQAAGYDDVIAPPNMLASIFEWGSGSPEADLNPDGTPAIERGALHRGLRGFGTGESMRIVAAVVAGTSLVEDEELESIELKHGRSGPMVLVTERHTFKDAATGEVLNVNRRVFVVREPYEESA